MHPVVDLRSDTLTTPTPEMRRAMAQAEVGDDVYGEDPTVQRLQEVAAARLGKAAALFVPSGTMGNEIAIRVHSRPGDEIILDEDCHIAKWELGAAAVLSGVQTRTLAGRRGLLSVEDIERRIHPGDDHSPRTALICLENTHNAAGGVILPLELTAQVQAIGRRHGIPVHLDGARLFNAAVALGRPVAELATHADSVMVCLSKGLACPVGSLLVGSTAFIDAARRVRRLFGGAMRQVGIVAAAGLVAFDTMVERLADDHKRARRLATAVAELDGFSVDMATVQTNMVYVRTRPPAAQVAQALARDKILCCDVFPDTVRLVTHKDVDDDDVERAVAAFRNLVDRRATVHGTSVG